MARRSTPRSKIDDLSFPVRIKVVVPRRGFGTQQNEMLQYLSDELGAGNYAYHSSTAMGIYQATAFYFRHPDAAVKFLERFPGLELAERQGVR